MQYAMAIFTLQAINQSTLMGKQSCLVDKTPVSLVKVESLFTGDRILGISIPCDQSELGEIPKDNCIGCVFHEASMHYMGIIFKR